MSDWEEWRSFAHEFARIFANMRDGGIGEIVVLVNREANGDEWGGFAHRLRRWAQMGKIESPAGSRRIGASLRTRRSLRLGQSFFEDCFAVVGEEFRVGAETVGEGGAEDGGRRTEGVDASAQGKG